nr:hypothetical protein [Tanacetum cinerariifolium]
SVPAVLSRSVPAVLSRSVPASLSRSILADSSRSVPVDSSRLVPAAVARSVPLQKFRSVNFKILDRLASSSRPVSAALPNITMTRPRYARHFVTKFKSPIRRHITRSPSSKTSNSPPRVTAVQAPVGNLQQALKDKGVIDSGCSMHMTGNMSYLSNLRSLMEDMLPLEVTPRV